jgi:hypothetical protein
LTVILVPSVKIRTGPEKKRGPGLMYKIGYREPLPSPAARENQTTGLQNIRHSLEFHTGFKNNLRRYTYLVVSINRNILYFYMRLPASSCRHMRGELNALMNRLQTSCGRYHILTARLYLGTHSRPTGKSLFFHHYLLPFDSKIAADFNIFFIDAVFMHV